MNHKVEIVLKSIYKTIPPFISIKLNDQYIINQKIVNNVEINETVSDDKKILKIDIQRTGRDKFVVDNETEQSVIIDSIKINNISINPEIGHFFTVNNEYVNDNIKHTKELKLNGNYQLHIPILPITGERNNKVKNLEKFNQKNINADVALFGASMTDYNFENGIPPIFNKNNYADLFIQQFKDHNCLNLGLSGLSNQEIFENTKYFFKHNTSKIVFVQLIGCVGRQIKNSTTGELYRWSIHLDNSKQEGFIDKFTGITPKQILDYFVYLDVVPLLALQLPYLQEFIDEIEQKGGRVYLISYFKEEYDVYEKAFPNNIAPYFDLDPNTKYCKDNGYHATPDEQENFYKKLVSFCQEKQLINF
jgi:hypothetical protein